MKIAIGWKSVVAIVGVIGVLIAGGMTAGMNEAGFRTVVRYPTGGMIVKFEPGWYLKLFGSATVYPDAMTYDFDRTEAGDGASLNFPGIPVQYGDGGMGTVFGTARINLPPDEDHMILLHKEARGERGVAFKVIKPTIDEASDKTAGLMNSSEGYQAKRNIFTQWAREQAQKGIYATEAKTVYEEDPVTGKRVSRDIAVIKLVNGEKQHQSSAFERYGMTIATFQMQKPDFEAKTMEQIAKKRDAENAIITAKAQAEEAKQNAITAEEKGKAALVTVRYEKMKEKEAAVVAAEQAKEVAEIAAAQRVAVAEQAKLEAEQEKLRQAELKEANILEGQGIAEKNRLIIESDGALDKRLAAYVKAVDVASHNLSKQKLVPDVQMGASQGNGVEKGIGLVDMLMVKTAKDLGLDTTIEGGKK